MPLPREHLLDELATAYVQALAAAGGATIAVSRDDADSWIIEGRDQLILRAHGYWWSRSETPTDNSSTVRIKIPITNRLTATAIEDMLRFSKERFV